MFLRGCKPRKLLASVLEKVSGAPTTAATAAASASAAAAAKEYTHIIVGGGSAGCVLANRLSANPANNVLLLEAGLPDRGKWDSWKIHMPAALTYNLADTKYNYQYYTEPQKHMDNRSIVWPRGKVLGGSSSLNAMVYVRGHAEDYNRWAKSGAHGWAYADCLPYFKKAQTHQLGPDTYRGGSGPLHVRRGNQPFVLNKVFIQAGIQAGYPYTDDMNGFQQEGFGPMDMTIHKGRRWSAATAYLRPALERPNLTVRTEAVAHRVVFEGTRAVGVEYSLNSAPDAPVTQRVALNGEVILSGGAINSPQLLLLSGVGPRRDLEAHGIPVVAHVPGVGENLQDHLDTYVQYKCKQPVTLHKASWRYPQNMISYGAEWFLFRTGMCTSAHLESGGFIRTRAGMPHPDLQYHFLPGALTGQLTPGETHAFQAHCSTMRPLSRGWLKLRSRDPRTHPIIQPNYLEHEQDVIDFRAGVRLTQEIFHQPAFDPYRGDPIEPAMENMTDDQIDAWVRKHGESAYHPCSTCKMGVDDLSVVDPALRVHGVSNLRVVDASVMPDEPSGNLNAPTIMIAEKAADIILGNQPLERIDAKVYEAKDWQTKQR